MVSAERLDLVLNAVAETRRRALLDRIAASEDGENVVALTRGSGITQGAVSQHLKVLKAAGLVSAEQVGRTVIYRSVRAGLCPIIDWLSEYERLWRGNLSGLRELLKEIDR